MVSDGTGVADIENLAQRRLAHTLQAAHLRELPQRMRDESQADTDTLLAIGALIGNLLNRQEEARRAFGEVFAGFLKEEHHQSFRTPLAAAPDDGWPT